MFKLEDELSQWRQAMHTAGLEPGPVLDELESHLRDIYEAAVRQGMPAPEAFAAAVSKLGPPQGIKREFDVAKPWARLRTVLQMQVPLFPSDMKLCALGAALLGSYVMYSGIDELRKNWGVVGHDLKAGDYFNVILVVSTVVFLVGLLGLTAAVGYLRRPRYVRARQVAGFWIMAFWTMAGMVILAVNRPVVGPATSPPWMDLITSITALVAYWDWKRLLKKQELRSSSLTPAR